MPSKITKSTWSDMEGKPMWDVMVALRGPDSYNSEGIKWYSTAVIRGIMSKATRVGGTVNLDLNVVVLPWVGFHEIKIESDWNWQHFIQHVEAAAQWLKIPTVYVDLGIWWNHRHTESRSKLGKIYLENISPRYGGKDSVAELERHVKEYLRGGKGGYAEID